MKKSDLKKFDRIGNAAEMLDAVKPYAGSDDWDEVAAYLPHTSHNQMGRVDFSGFSTAFDPLFVDASGQCLAVMAGEFVIRCVTLDS